MTVNASFLFMACVFAGWCAAMHLHFKQPSRTWRTRARRTLLPFLGAALSGWAAWAYLTGVMR